MDKLKVCPRCESEFREEQDGVQVCDVCEYWTKEGTARLDSIMIYA